LLTAQCAASQSPNSAIRLLSSLTCSRPVCRHLKRSAACTSAICVVHHEFMLQNISQACRCTDALPQAPCPTTCHLFSEASCPCAPSSTTSTHTISSKQHHTTTRQTRARINYTSHASCQMPSTGQRASSHHHCFCRQYGRAFAGRRRPSSSPHCCSFSFLYLFHSDAQMMGLPCWLSGSLPLKLRILDPIFFRPANASVSSGSTQPSSE